MAADLYLLTYLLISGLQFWIWKGAPREAPALTEGTKALLGKLVLAVLAIQLGYGLLDFGSGMARDVGGGAKWIELIRNWLALPPLAGFIYITDFFTTVWVLLIFTQQSHRSGKHTDAPSYFGLSPSAVLLTSIGIRISLLLGAVRLMFWDQMGMFSVLTILSIEIFLLFRLLRETGKISFERGHSRIVLFMLPILLPILEPLLGNALQMITFVALIAYATRLRKNSKSVGVDLLAFSQAESDRWSNRALAYLLSLAFPAMIIFSIHLTVMPPLEGQFENLMRPLALFQLTVILLSLAILRGGRGGAALLTGAIVLDLLARIWWIPLLITPQAGTIFAKIFSIQGMEDVFYLLYYFQFFLQLMIFYIVRVDTGFSERDFSSQTTARRSLRHSLYARLGLNLISYAGFAYFIYSGLSTMIGAWETQSTSQLIAELKDLALDPAKIDAVIAATTEARTQARVMYTGLLLGTGVLTLLLYTIGHDSPFKVNREAKASLDAPAFDRFKKEARRNPITLVLQLLPIALFATLTIFFFLSLKGRLNAALQSVDTQLEATHQSFEASRDEAL